MPQPRPIKFAPSILTANFGNLATDIQAAMVGGADVIHLDVMDGSFVPNITFGPVVVEAVRKTTSLPLDVHLMIQEPDRYLADFAKAGADSLTVHVEACLHLQRTVQQIRDLGCQAGVAINPATGIETVREILPFVDLVLVMTVNPGFGNQHFIETSLNKLRRLRKLLDELPLVCDLQVDGGIKVENIAAVREAGANNFVVGSAVYNAQSSVVDNLAALRRAVGLTS
jgi:ribulose-phosphate 3-epimerase